jgi:PAS domain S-box-containing protein
LTFFDATFTSTERKLTGPLPSSSDLNRCSNELNLGHERASGAFDRAVPGGRDEDAELLERYRTLFQFAPDPYLVTDQTGMIEEANAAAADLLGIDTSVRGRTSLATYLDAETRETLEARLRALAPSRTAQKWLVSIHSSNGEIIPVEATVSLSQRIAERPSPSRAPAWLGLPIASRLKRAIA